MDTAKPVSNPSKRIPRIPLPLITSKKQLISLPDSIIYYMAKNPSTSKCYLKLVQSCKYFFVKNPIIVTDRICNNGKHLYSNRGYKKNYYECCVKFDVTKLSSKIWITDELNISYLPTPYSSFTSKFYRREDALLQLSDIKITLKDFQLFASGFEKFHFCGAQIIDNDGNPVMLEKIVESIPNVKEFFYSSGFFTLVPPIITDVTMKNILKLKNLGNLRAINLTDIPLVLNLKDLDEFIKLYKNTEIGLCFCTDISGEYKNQLDRLIDVIIASEIPGRVIRYIGQKKEKLIIMCQSHTRYYM